MAKAREKFHAVPYDLNSLIYKDDFFKKLRAQYATKIENPVASDDFLSFLDVSSKVWRHVGEEKTWVTRPQFQHLEGENIYHWSSKVTFVRMYERTATLPSSLPAVSERRLMIFPIDVHWKAQVRSDGRFFDCEIVDWKEAESSFKAPSEGELERWGLQTKGESSVPPVGGTATS